MTTTHPAVGLYGDGGVIGVNPSKLGGTWAWCQVDAAGERIRCASGIVRPGASGNPDGVTNNLTEMLALIYGLESVPHGWRGTVYSDSQVSLGRLFLGWKLNGLPGWVLGRIKVIHRVHDLTQIRWVLLDGHPTHKQLDEGRGKRGNPVSIHNVWCDRACGEEAARFKAQLAVEVPA